MKRIFLIIKPIIDQNREKRQFIRRLFSIRAKTLLLNFDRGAVHNRGVPVAAGVVNFGHGCFNLGNIENKADYPHQFYL